MTSPDRLPPDLEAMLADHPEGEALASVWARLPRPEAAAESTADAQARRDRAFARVAARAGLAAAPATVPSLRLTSMARSAPAPSSRMYLRLAAAFALLIGGLATWQAVPSTHTVARGAAPRAVTLPDGSTISLAAGSRVSLPRGFRTWFGGSATERRVRIEGDAFFDVAKDGRAFIVETSDAEVRVLGTRFEVSAAHATQSTRVVVEEGRVAVAARSQAASTVELTAGQAAEIGRDGSPLRTADRDPQRVAVWRSGGLAIEDEPLTAVFDDLARRYGVTLTVDKLADSAQSVTLFYPDAPSIERVLSDLATARGLRWERASRGYLVHGSDTP